MSLGKFGRIFASASTLSLFAAGALGAAHAQSVTGEVTQSDGTSNLAGARVVIPALGVEATTSGTGQFTLSNVRAGTYTLEVRYLGTLLETRQITVSEDGLNLNINLNQRTLDTIIVSGRRGAIQSAAALEREADGVVSIVTSDDIGQFGDPTVAESLQRIAGVSINRVGGEGEQVSIRGLPTEFATITLDGARLGSSDPGINSTSLDFFSADNLSQIEVSKTLLPEMDADAIAGTVNLKTISALSRGRNSYGGRIEYGYQDKAEAWNPTLSGDFTHIFEMQDGSRIGLAGAVNFSSRERITDFSNIGDGLNFITLEERTNGRQEYYQGGDVDNCTDVQRDGGTILECYLIPQELDLRSEEEKTDRLSLSGQLEWETSSSLFQIRASYSDNTEETYTNRLTVDFSRSDGDIAADLDTDDPDVDEIVSFGVDTQGEVFGVFEDARAERRLRPGEVDEEIWTLGLEGTTDFGDNWTLNYGADFSSNSQTDERIEGRFRSDNITLTFADLNRDGIDLALSREVFDFDDDDLDPTTAAGFPIRQSNIGGDDFGTPNQQFITSDDEFKTFYASAERRLSLFEREAELKFGAQYRQRDRTFDFERIEYLVDPDLSLADFPNSPLVDRSDLNIPIDVERGAVIGTLQDFIAAGRVATEADRGIFLTIENLQNDFTAEEDVTAGYFQLKFEPMDRLEVIAGVRVEQTDYFTTGSAVRQLEFDDGITDVIEVALENGGVGEDVIDAFLDSRENRSVIEDRSGGSDYTEWFPSINLRWEPSDQLVLRASYTEGLKRPEFREAAAIQFLTTEERTDDDLVCDLLIGGTPGGAGCPADIDATTITQSLTGIADAEALLAAARAADTGNAFRTEADPARNPFLEPLTSQNWDASIAWYPNANTVLSAGVFHKQIDNFIVPISLAGDDVARLGFPLDDGTQDTLGISEIDTFANGDEAEITGLEIGYYQAFVGLPGVLSGLFAQGNATFADSSASSDLVDRDFKFPDQSDLIGNLSVGWENDTFSVRGAMVYQGERLRAINAGGLDDGDTDTAGDELEADRTQFDVNVRWEVREGVQVYFDAINITDAEDNRFFRGSQDTLNGPFFSRLENYGATYQAGVRLRF